MSINYRDMLTMELPGKRKRRLMDSVPEDIAMVEVTEDDAKYRTKWRLEFRCGDP